ncbi:hypothetical protein [Rhizobium sp. TRM95796]|uniref:hypothetical protein n=1 Tax=Rhizobium sp. TRM95796 TaxID=2979862 RepID=UPI0021E7AABC|nr:hypothetical protein [Rhizobium sp. TRM95796]MCV3768442.1 hypothetical protein [Rhizobium sp. TRM95796]
MTFPNLLESFRPDGERAGAGWLLRIVLLFSALAIAAQIGAHLSTYKDFIGPDPDDVMRLVEVRDWLGGQSWFDLHQYRMGPPGGMLMHWSRFVDAPIGGLILLFGLFVGPDTAEAAAAFVWPLALILPLMAGIGLGAYRLGGKPAVVIGLALAFMFLFTMMRFRPGGLDHHNVQLAVVALLAACLLDPQARARSFAAAGGLSAFALAIGAETTPLIAVAAMGVALVWAVRGQDYRRAAIAFGLAFAGFAALFFFATTPHALWGRVTCDTLSIGFLSIALIGGAGLAAAAGFASQRGPLWRWGSLALLGALAGLVALFVAPECLGNPLSSLDPMVQDLWLGSISEAQPIGKQFEVSPDAIGGIYGVGLIALGVALFRIWRGEQVLAYSLLAGLIAISWIVSAIQVRGMIFTNLLSVMPLSVIVADLRAHYLAHRNEPKAAIAFILAALASVPSVWAFSGAAVTIAVNRVSGASSEEKEDEDKPACIRKDSLAEVSKLPPGRILTAFNAGPAILRFTPHAVLTGNYHRNAKGLLDGLRMATSDPAVAAALMEADKVGYVLLCMDDPQVETLREKFPNGFWARLARGEIPEFLEPVEASGDPRMKIFRVIR